MDPKTGLQDKPIKAARNIILTFALWKIRSIRGLYKREIVLDQIKSVVASKSDII